WVISGVGVVLLGLSLIVPRVWQRPYPTPRPADSSGVLIALTVTGLIVFGFKAMVIDQVPNPLRSERFVHGITAGVDREILANFGDEITLIGASQMEPAMAGSMARFDLFWALTSTPIPTDYSTTIELIDSSGHVIAESGSFMPGSLATSNWLTDFYIVETVTF